MSLINLPVKKQAVEKYTWSTKPATAQENKRIIITDIGPADETFIFKNNRWAPINGQINLSTLAINVSVTGTTTNTQLHEVVVPAGLMSANGQLEVASLWSYTNSANSKTLRLYFGSFGGDSFIARVETSTTTSQYYTNIRNTNSVSTQIGLNGATTGGIGANGGAPSSGTVDTSLNQSLFFGAQLANSGETITLKGYKIIYRE
jgi:hypothetical protein